MRNIRCGMRAFASGFILVGILLVLSALIYEPTVPNDIGGSDAARVYNLGALQLRDFVFDLGALLFLSGIVLLSAAAIVDRLPPPRG